MQPFPGKARAGFRMGLEQQHFGTPPRICERCDAADGARAHDRDVDRS
jgi:hypothetical protein